MSSLIHQECEVCGEKDSRILEEHHIIPRTDPECTNSIWNLAIICASCHSKVHLGSLKIIGIFPSTKSPNNRTLVFEINGKKNLDIDEIHFKPKPKQMRIYERNDRYGTK